MPGGNPDGMTSARLNAKDYGVSCKGNPSPTKGRDDLLATLLAGLRVGEMERLPAGQKSIHSACSNGISLSIPGSVAESRRWIAP